MQCTAKFALTELHLKHLPPRTSRLKNSHISAMCMRTVFNNLHQERVCCGLTMDAYAIIWPWRMLSLRSKGVGAARALGRG